MSEEDQRSERLALSVYPETKRMVEETAREAQDRPDLPNLSMSQVGCYIIEQAIEDGLLDESVESLIPEEVIEAHRIVRERERIKAKTYTEDLAGGWRGRVKTALNARLAGEEPYTPHHIRNIAEGYREEAALYWSGDRLREARAWLDDRLTAYVEGYRAKQAVPDPLFDEVGDVDLGRDLYSLQDCGKEVVESIEEAAANGYDPDAILDRLTEEFAVSERALLLVVEWMTEEDTDPRRALKVGGEHFRTLLPDRALSGGSDLDLDPEALMPVEDSPEDRLDDSTEPLQFRSKEGEDPLGETEPEIDGDALASLMPEEVASDD